MTDLLTTITESDKGLAYSRMTLLCKHSPGYGCEFCRPQLSAHITRARTHLPAVNLLALDLGTNCGWAVAKRDGRMDYGTEKFPIRASGAGERWGRYRAWLSRVLTDCEIHVVYFEDVKAHGPGQVLAAHAYGAFLAMTEMVCHQHRVRMVGVGVGQVKKGWTGKGNAKKEAMVLEAEKRGFRPDTDNAADALAVAAYGIAKERA